MGFRGAASLSLQTPLSMSRVSQEDVCADAAEVERLVRLTLGGDSAAFEHIILRYEARVMNMAARLLGTRDEARDAAQEVFLRAFKYLHRLDLQKPVEPWLIRITVNVCRDAARTRLRRAQTFTPAENQDAIDESANQHDGLTRKEQRQFLQQALDELPAKERLAIMLRDVEGLSTAEVASILKSSETTVRSQVSRGRLKLKAAIDRWTQGITGGRS